MVRVLFDLVEAAEAISPDVHGDYVYSRFNDEPDCLALPVVDAEGRPVGLVERNTFFVAMAAHYGRALYAGRPISLLMNTQPLLVEGAVSVTDFCGEVLAERPSELMRGFIVTHEGRYAGVGSVLALLQATNAASQAHAREMTALAATLRQAQEEAQAALTAKSQFLAVMSHEIRTPLNGVLAIAEILERRLLQPELAPYVHAVQESGQTLLRLLTDALDLSRAEAGRLELAEGDFPVADLMDDVEQLWTARAELKGLTLDVVYDGPRDLWAMGDAIRIKQIFNNLIGNGLKFTGQGGVIARLSAHQEPGRVRLVGEVRDTGVGIPDDRLDTVFQPFSQTEVGVQAGGAGLGLSICRELVEQMGGTIRAMSNPGGGALFRFELPLAEAAAPATLVEGASEAPAEDGLGLRVLIADDNATNRLVAHTFCTMFGCDSDCVEDGEQAVEAMRRSHYDLVLMDIRMPGVDGVEATRRIRALPGLAATTPILALTANADPHDAANYLAQGMNGVVEKPVRAERLYAAITELFLDARDCAAA